eukprot:scaffold57_cov254-Pinguiococcus_pyrenoidosus.AAC.3
MLVMRTACIDVSHPQAWAFPLESLPSTLRAQASTQATACRFTLTLGQTTKVRYSGCTFGHYRAAV